MKTYRETMDELRFTEQEKEAMVDRLLELSLIHISPLQWWRMTCG